MPLLGTPGMAADAPILTRAIPSTGERLPVVGLGTDDYYSDSNGEPRRARRSAHDPCSRGEQALSTPPRITVLPKSCSARLSPSPPCVRISSSPQSLNGTS